MSWSVASMQSAGPLVTKAAGTTVSPALNQNNTVEVNDIIAIAIAFDNTTASAPNVSWAGGLTQTGGAAVATPPSYIHSNSPQSASAGGVRTAIILARVTAAGTITALNNITFSASITAKVTAVARIRGGELLTLANNIISRPATDFAVSGGAMPQRTLNNPSGSSDFLLLNVAGAEANSVPTGLGNGVMPSPTGSMSAATSGGSAVTNIGMHFGWSIGFGSGINWASSTASADASASMVMFGASYVPPPVAPTARTISVTGVSGGRVSLSWDVDTAAYPAPLYDVDYSTDGTNWINKFTNLSASSSATVDFLPNDILYYFRVRGNNSAGYAPWSNIVTATPVGFKRKHNFETGYDGGDITVDNAPGTSGEQDAFDYVLSGIGGTPKYSAAQKYNGALSGYFASAGSFSEVTVGWAFTGIDIVYARAYIYLTGAPGAETQIMRFGRPGDTVLFTVNLTVGGRLRINSAGGTTSQILPYNQWIRVEVMNAYGDETVGRVFLDPTLPANSPDSEFSTFLGDLDQTATARFGAITSSGAIYMDDIAVGDNGGFFGPSSVPPPPSANLGQFGMIPIF